MKSLIAHAFTTSFLSLLDHKHKRIAPKVNTRNQQKNKILKVNKNAALEKNIIEIIDF